MTAEETGRIVWHDLFSSDRQRSMAFYRRVAGWDYVTEHATDFAWGGGEKDFVLALLDGEAGAGFAETPDALPNGWIAYVEVRDVDATALLAERLGGAIVRQPFEVPGVGRNALLRDPLGALIGISLSRHGFPAPKRQFGAEVYLSDATTFPEAFYARLFEWTLVPAPYGPTGGWTLAGPSGEDVAARLSRKPANGEQATWIPSLKVIDLDSALKDAGLSGAKRFSDIPLEITQRHCAVLSDPQGAPFCLLGEAQGEASMKSGIATD